MPFTSWEFKDGLCFRCNKITPSILFCDPMYGTAFSQKYGWYINQRMLEFGFYPKDEILLMKEQCPEEVYEEYKSNNDMKRYFENLVRKEFGYKKIGEAWISEMTLFNIVSGILPREMEIILHYRPDWLERLELDIYIPSLQLGIEYQGKQHYEPVKHWGGEAQLRTQKEHDNRKKRLCADKGVKLLEVRYDDQLTTENIYEKIINICPELEKAT